MSKNRKNRSRGMKGVVVKTTGISERNANVLLVVIILSLFVLSANIFSATYTGKYVKSDYIDRIQMSNNL